MPLPTYLTLLSGNLRCQKAKVLILVQWGAAFFEWGSTWLLIQKDGKVYREDLQGVYDVWPGLLALSYLSLMATLTEYRVLSSGRSRTRESPAKGGPKVLG